MERIYIDRENCIAYIVLALHSVYHSANKERTINEIIKEVKTMFEIYEDEIELMNAMRRILKKNGEYKVRVMK